MWVRRVSYGVFFASFDVTRRCGLRVKALFGGQSDPNWSNILSITTTNPSTYPSSTSSDPSSSRTPTPTRARVAQATTIVAGGVTASILAEIVGRPFRTCQRLMTEHQHPDTRPSVAGKGFRNPVFELYKSQGLRPFFRKHGALSAPVKSGERGLGRMMKRFGWRLAAVGPWGAGFLVWAWVGGEV